jgi:ureidoacrylate peracid hydrolase
MPINGVKAGQHRNDPEKETIIWDLDPRKMALIVMDMQNCFCAQGGAIEVPASRGIVPKINQLAQECRTRSIPVIWVGWGLRPDGSDNGLACYFSPDFHKNLKTNPMGLAIGAKGTQIYHELKVMDEDYHVKKIRFSALIDGASDLERMLRTMERDTIIITGTTTDVCCESTAKDAMMLDFKVILISDATATYTEDRHNTTLSSIRRRLGMVCATDELIEELENQMKHD